MSLFDGISKWFKQLGGTDSAGTSGGETGAMADEKLAGSTPAMDKVLVFGATGKSGRDIVKALAARGKNVVACGRSGDKINDLMGELKGAANAQAISAASNVDVTDESTLSSELFKGVSQVVSCIGPVFGDEKLTSEAVDYKGNLNILVAMRKYGIGLGGNAGDGNGNGITSSAVFDFSKTGREAHKSKWSTLDDGIMGGSSGSGWQEIDCQGEGAEFMRFTGEVIVEGGGFCATNVRDAVSLDPLGFDGIALRVRGDGSRYKLGIKVPMSAAGGGGIGLTNYQASFDTAKGQWVDVLLPFDAFTCVERSTVRYNVPSPKDLLRTLSTEAYAGIKEKFSLTLLYSKFEFNKVENPMFLDTKFSLDVATISQYAMARPSLVMVSSAGTERVNKLRTDEERARDIPIVQLNPQGILNWKYRAEQAVRQSGIPYSIVCATDIVADSELNETLCLADLRQGDVISGRISRSELGAVVAAALESPYSAFKTFQVRRDESPSGQIGTANWGTEVCPLGAFQPLIRDSERVVNGMQPLPMAQDPPAPLTEERKQEILNDPRVRAVAARNEANPVANPKAAAVDTKETVDA